jgi:hypothetical protein
MRVHNAEDRLPPKSTTLLFPALAIKARPKPNLRNRKSLNFQDTIGRTQEIEVEEVETVETVEATEERRELNGSGFFTGMKKQTLTAA